MFERSKTQFGLWIDLLQPKITPEGGALFDLVTHRHDPGTIFENPLRRPLAGEEVDVDIVMADSPEGAGKDEDPRQRTA